MKHILAQSLVLVFGLLFLAGIPPRASAQGSEQARITQIDSSNFPKVTAYVSVTGPNGEPIGVDPSRITLTEDGKPIKPELVRATSKQAGQVEPVTTLLVVDVSGSMNEGGKLDAAKNAAAAYVEQMRQGDQAGLVAFNDKVQYVQPIMADKNALKSAIGKLSASDNTAMYDALSQGVKTLSNAQGRKAIIALTDGMDNRSAVTADSVVSGIGPAGLSISMIGFGDTTLGTSQFGGIDEPRLKSLADRAGGAYAYAKDSDALKKIYELYARVLQNEYAITFTSLTNLRDGVNRSLAVSVAAPSGAPINAQGRYNPGGVIPELAKSTGGLPIFPIAMAGLILLLLAPGILSRAGHTVGWEKRGGRVRLGTSHNAHGNAGKSGEGVLARAGGAVKGLISRWGKKKPRRVRIYDPLESRSQMR